MRPRKLLWTLVILAGLGAAACPAIQPDTTCATDDDCFNDEAGIRYVCDETDTRVCLRWCESNAECLALQYCDVPTAETEGVCRDSQGAPPPDGGSPRG